MAQLVEAGLANAAVAALLALLALVVSRCCRRPALVHALWLLVLLKLVTPPLFRLPVPGWREEAPPVAEVPAPVETPFVATEPPPAPPPIAFTKIMDIGKGLPPEMAPALPPAVRPPQPKETPKPKTPIPTPHPAEEPAPAPFPWLTVVGGVWLAGAAIYFLLAAWRVWLFQRLLRHAAPAPAALVDEVRRLAASMGLRSVPSMWLVPGPLPPLLWAFGPARLLLPAALMGKLEEPGRLALLVHELAHYARRDHWTRWLELLAAGLFWWYPVAWLARHGLHAAEEECCDAWVAAELPGYGAAYAGAILDTVDFLSTRQVAVPPAASGFGAMSQLKKRLAAIVQSPLPRSVSAPGWAALLLAALLLPLVPGRGPAATDRAEETDKTDAAAKKDKAKKDAPLAARPARRDPPGYKDQSRVLGSAAAGQVWAVALSPDEKTLAVATGGTEGEGAVVLFDYASGNELASVVEAKPVRCVAFSPDGKWLATGDFENNLKLRDPRTAETKKTLKGHSASVNAVAFSGDSKTILTASLDKTLKLWDAEKGTVVRTLEGHTDWVLGAAFSTDGKTVVSASKDGTGRVWDAATGKVRHALKGHASWVEGAALSPDGKTAATCGHDNLVKVWDAATGKLKATHEGHTGVVNNVAFSKDGDSLYTVSHDLTARMWGVEGGLATTVGDLHSERIYGLAVASDGTMVTGGWDRMAKTWHKEKEQRTFRPKRYLPENLFACSALAASPDGKLLAVGGDERVIKILDAATGVLLRLLEGHEDAIGGLAFSPDGKTLASAGFDGRAILWDAGTGKILRKLEGHTNWVFCVAFSSDGRNLATGGYDRTVRLWDAGTGKESARFTRHKGGVRAVAFDPKGGRLASTGTDRTIRLWDLKKLEEVAVFKGHEEAVRALAWSADGRLASASEDNKVKLWDDAGKELRTISVASSPTIPAVAFTPGGSLLASTDGNGIRLDGPTGQTGPFARHTEPVSAVAFSPDGMTMYTASRDRVVRAWPAASERRLWETLLEGDGGQMWFNLFSPDGKRIASGGQGKLLRIRPASLGSAVRVPGALPAVYGSARSPDGKAFALGLGDGAILLIDAATGKRQRLLKGHKERVWGVAFSPDGKRLASVSGSFQQENEPGEAKVWDLDSGKSRPIGELTASAQAVAWSPDGKWIALGQRDGQAFLVDPTTGKEKHVLKAGNGGARSAAFSSDGSVLVTGDSGGDIKLWDAATGKEKQAIKGPPSGVNGVAFSPDGGTLAACTRPTGRAAGEVWIFKKKGAEFAFAGKLKGNKQSILSLAFSPDGKEIATGGGFYRQAGEIVVWDAAALKPRLLLGGHRDWIETVGFSHDGKSLLTAGGSVEGGGEARVWDIVPGGWHKADAHKGQISAAAWSPDGSKLVTGGYDRALRVWDAATGKLEAEWEEVHKKWVRSVAFSPDGKRLATCGDDKAAKVWDFATKELVHELDGFHDMPMVAAFSPDGKRLALACGDPSNREQKGAILTYDTEEWKQGRGMWTNDRAMQSVAWSPCGKMLAIAGLGMDSASVVDSSTMREKAKLRGAHSVRCVAWSRCGKRIATAHGQGGTNGNGSIQVWDAASGREEAVMTGHGTMVLGLAFGPDGRLGSAGNDGTARTWERID
ncbi:MAG: hypothetical protein K2W96_03495 [Gemmataceae bacterium]|nr:hypothetical protein [Gemmataceae bacterium]